MRDMRKGNCEACDYDEVIEAHAARWVFSTTPTTAGVLRMYICRKCGYTQWYAEGAEKMPIGEQYKTRLIRGVRLDGPYR